MAIRAPLQWLQRGWYSSTLGKFVWVWFCKQQKEQRAFPLQNLAVCPRRKQLRKIGKRMLGHTLNITLCIVIEFESLEERNLFSTSLVFVRVFSF